MTTILMLSVLLAPPTQMQPFVRLENASGAPFSGTIMHFTDAHYILTCGHGVKKAGEQVTITINRSKQLPGYVEAVDHERDLAIVRCRDPNFGFSTRLYPVADECPTSGTAVRYGFERGQHVQRRGEIRGERDGLRLFQVAGRGGDSGAGIIHDGKLVGVHLKGWEHQGWSAFVPAETIQEFLGDNPPVEDEKVRDR